MVEKFKIAVPGRPRILVVRRDNIGDLVCTIPLATALRRHYPDAFIAFLVNSYNAPVLVGHPAIDRVYIYEKLKHLAPGQNWLGSLFSRLGMAISLRRSAFDLVILATPLPTQHWFKAAAWAGGQAVLAMDSGKVQMPNWIGLRTQPTPAFWKTHSVQQGLELLKGAGLDLSPGEMRIYPDAALLANAQRQLAELSADPSSTVLGIHISARKISQRWSAQRFADLMARLHARSTCRFVVFWSPGSSNDPRHPGDDEKAQELLSLTRGLPVLPLPTRSLPELIAGLAVVDRVVCSDGGAMHLAAALQKPIVCLFGDSDAVLWHPWGVPYRLLQPESRDVRDVSPEMVLAAFEDLESAL